MKEIRYSRLEIYIHIEVRVLKDTQTCFSKHGVKSWHALELSKYAL